MQTVTAYPVVGDVPASLRFLEQVFGAQEEMRAVGSAGGYHAEIRIGDSALMLGGGGADVSWKGEARPMAFHIYVPDVDSVYRRALESGAKSLQEPAEQAWSERTAHVEEPAGNRWYIATCHGENYFSEGAPTIQPFLHPVDSEPLIQFLTAAFGARDLGRAVSPQGSLLHTTLKIGNSALEMGDAVGIYQPLPGMFYCHVADADAAYRRALECGAGAHCAPADQSYGERTGAVTDPAGNIWYLASPAVRAAGS